MQLKWNKCQGEVWCKLNSVNLPHAHFNNMDGVYIIWHGGTKPSTVRVGLGVIRDRLAKHRVDPEIQKFTELGLFVTWAAVPSESRTGVENYLADRLKPIVGERFPDVPPIEVNLPW